MPVEVPLNKEAKQNWHLNKPPKRTAHAMHNHVLMVLMLMGLTRAYREYQAGLEAERALPPTRWASSTPLSAASAQVVAASDTPDAFPSRDRGRSYTGISEENPFLLLFPCRLCIISALYECRSNGSVVPQHAPRGRNRQNTMPPRLGAVASA